MHLSQGHHHRFLEQRRDDKSLRIDETRMDDGSIHLFISQAFDELVA